MRTRGADTVEQAGELRLARVESLRALAASGVVAGHLIGHYYSTGGAPDSYLTRVIYGGGFGVLLFFCLTGYLLFWPFVRQHFLGGDPLPLRRYALNRFLRIFPLYWISLVIVLALRDHPDVEHAWLKYMLFAENFFADSIGNPQVNGALWSVVVELHFYALLPLMAWGIAVASRRTLVGASAILLIAGAISLALWIHYWEGERDVMWRFNLPASFFFFTGGMQLALLRARIERSRPRWLDGPLGSGELWFAVGIAFWLVAWYRYDLVAILAVGSALLLAPCVLPLRAGPMVRSLSWRPLAYAGMISYSIYVWQGPLQYAVFDRTGDRSPAGVALAVALIAIVAPLSFRVFETPFLRLRRRWTRGANVPDERGPTAKPGD